MKRNVLFATALATIILTPLIYSDENEQKVIQSQIPSEPASPKASATPEELHNLYNKLTTEPGSVTFTPPADWSFADPTQLPSNIKMMVIGKAKNDFPPSINIGFEEYQGNSKQFLAAIKRINQQRNAETKDLGTVRTSAGPVMLLQVDSKTKWGNERQLQAILKYEDKMWFLTCSAIKEEFADYYRVFFDAIKSLKANPIEKKVPFLPPKGDESTKMTEDHV